MSADTPQHRLDDLIRELEEAAAALRGHDLEPAEAAALVDNAARLAGEAAGELDRQVRAAGSAGP
jgi:hypothetical protein